jgi:flagellum-specific peptidoglycan hydrolase FlgJ
MKKAKSRATLALDSEGNYARFNTWRESVIDYALYQSMFVRKIKSRDAYISHLADSYATSSNYSSHLIQVINEVKDKF